MIVLHRVEQILTDSLYAQWVAKNVALEKERPFCGHDWQHMLDVARIAYILVLEDVLLADLLLEDAAVDALPAAWAGRRETDAAKELIYAAGLLHDIARWQEYETGVDHALAGSLLAGPVLERAGYDDAERELIVTAIREHRGGGQEASPLGQYLCQADDLSRPCARCGVRGECHKIHRMPAASQLLY
ncbi:MAG: HD domain-containing protein [Firmicutes bacterium]|nr:HD domain-containing protein [Bacillota bacterium]